jgi:hypothetical protein
MNDLVLVLGGLVGGIFVIYLIASLLQNKANAGGNLFTGQPSPKSRVIAFVFAVLFGGIFLLQYFTSDQFLIIMPVLSLALLAYSFGFTKFIRAIQRMDDQDSDNQDY